MNAYGSPNDFIEGQFIEKEVTQGGEFLSRNPWTYKMSSNTNNNVLETGDTDQQRGDNSKTNNAMSFCEKLARQRKQEASEGAKTWGEKIARERSLREALANTTRDFG